MESYRRRGTVIARRLTSARPWATDSGDRLLGHAGDWWVVDDDGHGRSVRDADFRATHEWMHGDVYRRSGVLQARQVTTPETVPTKEGFATALPGMWVVCNEHGESWPVPDLQFRKGYELITGDEDGREAGERPLA